MIRRVLCGLFGRMNLKMIKQRTNVEIRKKTDSRNDGKMEQRKRRRKETERMMDRWTKEETEKSGDNNEQILMTKSDTMMVTRKSSCVNARGIPPAMQQVLPMLFYLC